MAPKGKVLVFTTEWDWDEEADCPGIVMEDIKRELLGWDGCVRVEVKTQDTLCGHRIFAGVRCGEMACPNYAGKFPNE